MLKTILSAIAALTMSSGVAMSDGHSIDIVLSEKTLGIHTLTL